MEKENKNVRFAFIKINTDQFAIIDGIFKNQSNVEFKFGLQFGANRDTELLSVKVLIQYAVEDKDFLIFEASCMFKIDSEDWKNLLTDNEIVVPKGIMTHLAVLTIGTVRGIFHSKTEGTNYNGFIIPTINVTELILEDVRL